MKNIAIYGAGGFGREVACLLNKNNEVKLTWELIGLFNVGLAIGMEVLYFGTALV